MLLLIKDRIINTDQLITAQIRNENHLVLTMNGTSESGKGYTVTLNGDEAKKVWDELSKSATNIVVP